MTQNFHRRSPHPKRKGHRQTPKKKFTSHIRAGSDAALKPIFEQIGAPEARPFAPDRFQLEAVEAVRHGDCLVTAPTGSGKTWIAEQVIRKALERGERCWYATPLKALTNTIFSTFCDLFGKDKVGILTGDIKDNADASIIVGTTEILRNQLYDAMHTGQDLGTNLVVMDEAHYLGDRDRGVVWEEVMIYLPSRVPLLMLSATVGNAHQIAEWLTSIRGREVQVIEETHRSVPLHPLFFHPSGTLFPLISQKGAKGKVGLHKKVTAYMHQDRPPILAPPNRLPPMGEIMKVLKKYRLLPAIFFMKSRADCNGALELCSGEVLAGDPARADLLSQRVDEILSAHPHLSKHKQRYHLEHLAVGAHHSGQLPGWKIVIETLMNEGLLDAMFATSTVAAGVNFPARSVVILNSDRFNGVDFESLSSSEYNQMTGRAGRRGKDKVGFAVILPGKFNDLGHLARLTNQAPERIESQININFSMVLNLMLSNTPDQIRGLLEQSFATFLLEKKRGKSVGNSKLWEDFLVHLDFLKLKGFVDEENRLTVDGQWASRLRIDAPLMVGECFRLKLFPEDPALMAAMVASFVNERERDDDSINRSVLPKSLTRTFLNIRKGLTPFAREMIEWGFEAPFLYLHPAATIYLWASGTPWNDVLQFSGLQEGDLSRLVLRTADNLHHIAALKSVFPRAAAAAAEGKRAIMKDPIVTTLEEIPARKDEPVSDSPV
ncbi:DEAD/DEAH box helicase [Desulfoluna sp.]|uniref:DEAD/DEAH box helicase n=1 Tax=Desulfoluna sp. TaxID=2045199 RepID=UPI002619D4AB|nr:DEAD/DEAH box helicase [Desulfoluna sp.]